MKTRTLHTDGPFHFRRTIAALGVGSMQQDDWWWATLLNGEPNTVHLSYSAPRLEAHAWGPDASTLLERVPTLVGLDDEVTIAPRDDHARQILDMNRGVRLGSTGDVHSATVKAVLGQVVTTKEANRSLRRLTAAHGIAAPGPNESLRTAPPPERIAAMSYDELHSFGVERSRASVLIETSRRANRLAEILTMDRGAAYERLTAIRGVGVWTASLVMGAAWGDKDAIPIGDYHMPNAVAWALAGEDRGTDERMIELLDPYRPERRRMVLAIKQNGIHAPRYGPKTAVRTHL